MLDLIEEHRGEIVSICQRHGVRRLELFGSAARDEFDPSRSDLDFFVEFLDYHAPTIADDWFALQEDLELLLGYRVDLTSLRTAKNPFFLQSANRDKIILCAN